LIKAVDIVRYFRLVYSAILQLLSKSIVAIDRDNCKNIYKRFLNLNTQVIDIYKTNCFFDIEARNKIVNSFVKQVI